ncbi:transketolase [Paracrocinitomix mangrovi]|uniref:transketolase n=1 Tax=Paracrocinitomix mangrovi TaxID=2862509 RepID=UPI001C8D7301|nr:transketolase [Paracrocinitomix mangrovi]UKN02505.1 transketolase [Paracrocinitomix mangrovi]
MAVATTTEISSQIRRDIIRMVTAVQSGHPGGSLGCADFFSVLFFEVLNINPDNFTMDGIGEDLFFLSNGHISPVLYSTLAHRGYFDKAELGTFRKLNSRLQGHPSPDKGLPGVRIATGSLGQGLSVGIGAALAKKLNGDDKLVFTLHGDGELQEGQIWEAAMYAAGNKVDNLIATVDYNHKQIDGDIDDVLPMGDLAQKWQAFGWEVLKMDGHDHNAILDTLNKAKSMCGNGKPIVIIMETVMGQGVDFMMHTHKWHGSPPSEEQAENALSQLEETLGDY